MTAKKSETKVFSAQTRGAWAPLTAPSKEAAAAVPGHQELLKRSLLDLLRSENLIVMTGLGASLCVPNAPTMWHLWDGAKSKAGEPAFSTILKKVHYTATIEEGDPPKSVPKPDIELLLSHCHLATALQADADVEAFIRNSEQVIVDQCGFVTDDVPLPTHEAFLRRIARRSLKAPRTRIFSTNYDLCFETAASRSGFLVIDGFSQTIPAEFDSSFFTYDIVRRAGSDEVPTYIPNVFHLYKLHGSVNWDRVGDRIWRAPNPAKPVLIYPRHTKFESSYEPPFLDVMSAFQAALRQPNTALLVIGFGFNDKHLAQPLLSAIRSNVGLRIVVVDPVLETVANDSIEILRNLVAQGDARVTLVASKFEEFVPILPDLVAETESERHEARLRRRGE